MQLRFVFLLFVLNLLACQPAKKKEPTVSNSTPPVFTLKQNGDQIEVWQAGVSKPIIVQNAKADFRPYIHPITAPQSEISLTQYSPDHHKHQTGLYWGFTRVNGTGITKDSLTKWFYNPDKPADIQAQIGRDFFHHPDADYWQRVAATVLKADGDILRWQTIYNLIDADKKPILKETQTWTFSHKNNKHLLELEWKGEAIESITINEFDYGGLFLRMPWHKDVQGEAINTARQRNEKANGQRAQWVDVGMAIDGLNDWGHIAIFDHPDNDGFPTTWRVDGQLGIGPVRAKQGDWHIKKGETATFRHQVVAYSGKLNDIEMDNQWGDFAGDKGMYNTASLWNIAQEEGRQAKLLSPEEAVSAMTIKEGYKVNAFASEPMITQPMAFCWDDKGRMWIAENRDYESRGHGFSNSGDSRILILEDTDKDGKADKQTVFLKDIPFPSAIAVGFDGLYLGAPPNLLFVPDKNGDDKADEGGIRVLLTGWGIRDRHETINSFHWGPDGWLYGLEGFATPSKIRKPIGNGRIYKAKEAFPEDLLETEGVDINGGVWRYHPVKDRFEVVAHGFSNPWGIDYDAKGQLFISACVIPHLFHIIPGGIYHRQGGSHFNPYVYEDIQTIVDHRHRSAHGGARVYLSDAFPDDQRGRIFMANIHEHAVLSDILKNKGSGFTASHGEDFMLANNAQWIGFSMEIGPEGGLYVLDWHDADICGKEVVNKETGRVFRILPEKTLAENFPNRYADLNTLSDIQLIDFQSSKSNWHSQRARVILQKRAFQNKFSKEGIQRLNDLFYKEKNGDIRLRFLWTKQITNQLPESELIKLVNDDDPYIRSWAIQFLTEENNPSEAALKKMTTLAQKDKSPVVRLYLSAALQRMPQDKRWPIIEKLVQHDDATDPNIPFMIWFGLEPLVASHPEKTLSLAANNKLPSVSKYLARRLVDADKTSIAIDVLDQNFSTKTAFLEGLMAGLEGRTDIKEPSSWAAISGKLLKDEKYEELVAAISQQFGNAAAAENMLAILKNKTSDIKLQQNAIVGLAKQQRETLIDEIPTLLENPDLRMEAIRAIAAFEKEELGKIVLKKYPTLNATEKREVLQTLSSRTVYGRLLADAIKNKSIPKKEVPPYVALQLRRVVGNGFVEIWGPIDQLAGSKKADYAKYQRLLTNTAIGGASAEKGRLVFLRTCQVCHKMYDEGGVLGPDLTGSNRANIPYLLGNILDPSEEIQDDYKMVVITTNDGRTYTGNITAENNRQVTLRTVSQDALLLNKSDIQSREVTPKSMMPEGLFSTLTETEILDLAAYLRTTKQVERMLQ